MNDSHNNAPRAYQTGPTTPPKSHGGLIAFVLTAVIFFSGIASLLSLMNIPVFELSESKNPQDISRLSDPHPAKITEPAMLYHQRRSDHGIQGQDLSDVCRNYYSLPQGIYITQVETGTDFYAKGLRMGDIVLDLNDTPIPDSKTLETVLFAVADGEPVTLTFYRQGRHHQVSVQVTTLEGE